MIGPASDIYSLGATLYYAACRQAPAGRSGPRARSWRASSAARSCRHARSTRAFRTALEAIVLKAMALKAADRYQSARALAEEVERWLADEPVLAWREPILGRARRWMRRRQTLVAVIGRWRAGGPDRPGCGLSREDPCQCAPSNGRISRSTWPTAAPRPPTATWPAPMNASRLASICARGDQDIPHRGQRRLPPQGETVRRPAGQAAGWRDRLLPTSGRLAQGPVRSAVASRSGRLIMKSAS